MSQIKNASSVLTQEEQANVLRRLSNWQWISYKDAHFNEDGCRPFSAYPSSESADKKAGVIRCRMTNDGKKKQFLLSLSAGMSMVEGELPKGLREAVSKSKAQYLATKNQLQVTIGLFADDYRHVEFLDEVWPTWRAAKPETSYPISTRRAIRIENLSVALDSKGQPIVLKKTIEGIPANQKIFNFSHIEIKPEQRDSREELVVEQKGAGDRSQIQIDDAQSLEALFGSEYASAGAELSNTQQQSDKQPTGSNDSSALSIEQLNDLLKEEGLKGMALKAMASKLFNAGATLENVAELYAKASA